MKKAAALVIAMGAICSAASGSYEWTEYSGHMYAITEQMGDWDTCESEAMAVGGHLATINTAEENAWLATYISDLRTREYTDPSNNIAWIGYIDIGSDTWVWSSGEPVTFTNYYSAWPENGTHAYLLGEDHFAAGEWSAHDVHNDFTEYHPYGIIEVVPEPGTLALLGFGALVVRVKKKSV